jgi:hypothetical protein
LVFEGFKRSGRGFHGDWLDEGRGRDGARLGFLWCTGGARRTTAAAGRTVEAVLATEGGRRAPSGPNATWAGAERKQRERKKMGWAARMTGPKSKVGLQKIPFQILNQGFEFK